VLKYSGPLDYMTAIIQDGNRDRYVQVVPGDSGDSEVTLATVRQYLASQSIPVHDLALALDPAAFEIKEVNTTLLYLVGTIGPYILVIAIIWFFIIRQMRAPGGGGGVLSFGRSKAAVYSKENRTNITFDDVAGADEAKEEVREIIEFLKHPGKFAKLGGSIPRGVLLVGPPGTGKTLMAKAIAGEAEVPFFSISGSDFVEMFVGVGASRVRDLFKQARESSPCLIFLDEIDAVGRKRGSGMGGGHDEREQTLNAILVEMDGFDSDKGIILIAATNRPDVLDPALLRPGRFDRQIVIDMPHLEGREEILKVHGRKVKLSPRVDLAVIARATPGFSGADLAAIINEAAILAAMKGQDAIETVDLEEARDRVRWGREKRSRAMEEEDRRVTAYHEAGHALVSIKIPVLDPVHKVTIVSRGMALGATMSLPERDDYHTRKNKLLGLIAMCYGGRIAEEKIFGDISAGAQNDIEKATEIARVMVCQLGMSDAIGPINYSAKSDVTDLGREQTLAYDLSQETMEQIHVEVRRIIQEQYGRAETIIQENLQVLEAIAESLLLHETLTGQEVLAIARGDDLDDFRAAQERAQKAKDAKDDARRAAAAAADEREEPDVGLSGAEGLAHP
jgi:cell division protease FtsH